MAKAAVPVSGWPTAARAVATALAAPPGPVIANMDDGATGTPGTARAENGVEAQTLRAYENMAARAGRAGWRGSSQHRPRRGNGRRKANQREEAKGREEAKQR